MDNPAIAPKTDAYNALLQNVGNALTQGRSRAAAAVNAAMVQTYWEIGRQIVEYEQKGNERAEYGSDVLNRLSRDLTERYGKGFSHSNLVYIRKLYLTYPKSQTLSDQLTWSHYVELLKVDDPLERSFYEKESVRRRCKARIIHSPRASIDASPLVGTPAASFCFRITQLGANA